MTEDQVRELSAQGESQAVEFKKTFAEDNEGIESLGAFANTDGGTVLFGVADDGSFVSPNVGQRTLEGFANKLRRESQPPLPASLEVIALEQDLVVAVSVPKPQPGHLYYTFSVPRVRMGKTNQIMSPSEQQARVCLQDVLLAEERDRPTFERTNGALTRLASAFKPEWGLKQASGDYVPNLQWRFRGPRFQMEWR